MKVNGQSHVPATPPPLPLIREAGWAPQPVWMLQRPLWELNPVRTLCSLLQYQLSRSGTQNEVIAAQCILMQFKTN
jgi:hypothetical protein